MSEMKYIKDRNENIVLPITSTKAVRNEQGTNIETLISAISEDLTAEKAKITNKADKATTLAGYGITDGYTKTEGQALETQVTNAIDSVQDAVNQLNGNEVVVVADHSNVTNPDGQKIYREQGSNSYTDWMHQDSNWKQIATYTMPGIDNAPTKNSSNFVKSGGVFKAIQDDAVFDVSAHNLDLNQNPTPYESLALALAAIPTDYKKGGMSIKFIKQDVTVSYRVVNGTSQGASLNAVTVSNQFTLADGNAYSANDILTAIEDTADKAAVETAINSLSNNGDSIVIQYGLDGTNYAIWTITKNVNTKNEYVQYRFIGATNDGFTNVANWQGVDTEITEGSHNLPESSAVEKELSIFNIKGNNNAEVSSSKYCNIKAGNKYRIYIKNPNIDMSGVTVIGQYKRFTINSYNYSNTKTELVSVILGVEISDYYDIIIPNDGICIDLTIRATRGEILSCYIEDITVLSPVETRVTTLEGQSEKCLFCVEKTRNLWDNGDQSFTRSIKIPFNLPAGTYTISAIATSSDTDANTCRVVIRNTSDDQIKYFDFNRGVRSFGTFTVNQNIGYIQFLASDSGSHGEGDAASFFKIQIEAGSDLTNYISPYIANDTVARENDSAFILPAYFKSDTAIPYGFSSDTGLPVSTATSYWSTDLIEIPSASRSPEGIIATNFLFAKVGFYKADGAFIGTSSNTFVKAINVIKDANNEYASYIRVQFKNTTVTYDNRDSVIINLYPIQKKVNGKAIADYSLPISAIGKPEYDIMQKLVHKCGMDFGAHKGVECLAPENSIPAYELAGKQGWEWVWIAQIKYSSEGTLYVMHDETVDRTTDGTGTMSEMTDAQINALRLIKPAEAAGCPYDISNFTDEELVVPTLEKVFQICKRYGMKICLRLGNLPSTGTTDFQNGLWATLKSLVDAYGITKEIAYSGTQGQLNRALTEIGSDIECCIYPSSGSTAQEMIDYFNTYLSTVQNKSCIIRHTLCDLASVKLLHNNNIKVYAYQYPAYSVGEDSMIEQLAYNGVDVYQNGLKAYIW